MLQKRMTEEEVWSLVNKYNSELLEGEEVITFQEYCDIENIVPRTSFDLLMEKSSDSRDPSKVNKVSLIRAIRAAANRSDLANLGGAKALAEQIADQVNKEFKRLEKVTVIDDTVDEPDYHDLIIQMFDNVRGDGERICYNKPTNSLLFAEFDEETGVVTADMLLTTYQALDMVCERLEKRKLSMRRVERTLKDLDCSYLAQMV